MADRTFGIDFGTTNSLVATVASDRIECLTDGDRPHPSVVWYRGGKAVVGRAARDQLARTDQAVVGDFVVSPKRLIGETATQFVGGLRLMPEEIAYEVLRYLKEDAVNRFGADYDVQRAVLTVPVTLDGRGRRALRRAASRAGIHVIQFVHEPLAALYGWIRLQEDPEAWAARMKGRPILVFDWGGGTLDLTLCVIEDGRLLQIANDGDATVGGDRFDQHLATLVRQKHAVEHGIGSVEGTETEGAANRLRTRCELAKIGLSSRASEFVVVREYLPGSSAPDLAVQVTRQELLDATSSLVQQGMAAIDRILRKAGCRANAIDMILPTGGMVEMPAVRDALTERFPGRVAEVRRYSRGDRLIAEGAGWLAADGVRLELSKALDVEEAHGEYAEILPAGTLVPEIDAPNAITKILYCVDPALGEATIRFAVRKGIGAFGQPDTWRNLGSCLVPVAKNIRPFVEKIEADVRLDKDCVALIGFQGSVLRAPPVKAEIYVLEFGIALPWRTASEEPEKKDGGRQANRSRLVSKSADGGLIRLRSNIAAKEDWRVVPGEVVKHFEPNFFDVRRWEFSQLQLDQYFEHERCRVCNRRDDVVWRDGCDRCAKAQRGRRIPGGHLQAAETSIET